MTRKISTGRHYITFGTDELYQDSSEYMLVKKNKSEESEEINYMKNILEIYEERKKAKIKENYNKQIEELKLGDSISMIIEDTNRLIQELDPNRKFPKIVYNVYTQDTLDIKKAIDKDYDEEIKKLNETIEEIKAYFYMTNDFTEMKTILRNYNIIDKKGKLII